VAEPEVANHAKSLAFAALRATHRPVAGVIGVEVVAAVIGGGDRASAGRIGKNAIDQRKLKQRYALGGRIAVASTSMRKEGLASRVTCSSVEAGSALLLVKKDARTSR
jgi:hypothetical protein